jgi:hypothetical protein
MAVDKFMVEGEGRLGFGREPVADRPVPLLQMQLNAGLIGD